MGENKIIKNVSIVIISILIIAIIGLGIYMIFIKKDDDGVNNNKNNIQDNYVDTKVSYGTSDDVHLEYPNGIDDKNLTKREVKPFKSITSILEDGESIKIDENLTLLLGYYGEDFEIVYQNKKLNLDIEEEKVTGLSIICNNEYPLNIYKLGEIYLIKVKSAIGQNDWDWLLVLNEKGELTWLTDEVDDFLSYGTLQKVEYVSNNLKNFYQLTIEGFSESDGPSDWKPEDTHLYIYKK